MFISHGIWLLRTREIRARARANGLSFDEFPEAIAWQAKGINVDETFLRKLCSKASCQRVDVEELNHEC